MFAHSLHITSSVCVRGIEIGLCVAVILLPCCCYSLTKCNVHKINYKALTDIDLGELLCISFFMFYFVFHNIYPALRTIGGNLHKANVLLYTAPI